MPILLILAAVLYYSLGETTDAWVLVGALVLVLAVRWALQARPRRVMHRLAQSGVPKGDASAAERTPPLEGEAPLFFRRAGVLFRRSAVVAIAVAAVLFAVSFGNGQPWMSAALAAATFAMAAIPVGLPIVLTRSLSAAVWRLMSRGVIVTRPAAIELLGSTTVLCVDQTSIVTRPDAPDALIECRRAGIHVVMVVGDDEPTARAAAEAADFAHDGSATVTGEELQSLRENERASRVRHTTVFARMSPEQKFLVVDELQRAGAVVAMMGEGIDDGPALRRADVGIVNARNAGVASAAVVLHDGTLASIVDAFRAGRHAVQSSQRALLYLFAFHLPIAVLAMVAPLAGVSLAILPIHVAWLGLLALCVAATLFPAEVAGEQVMQRTPRVAASPLLPSPALLRSALSGAAVALGAWVTYSGQIPAVGEGEARALALIVLIGGNQTLMFAERLALPDLYVSAVPRTRVFWLVWLASAASLGVVLYVPPVARSFGVVPPSATATIAALALGVLAVGWRFAVAPGLSAKSGGAGPR